MRIKSIQMKNFRQYRDFKLTLNVDDLNKNVTVIRAKNSTGKTTFAQAILWCLYGETMVDLDRKKEMVNKYALKEAIENDKDEVSYSVELEIIDHNRVSVLKRKQIQSTATLRKKAEFVQFSYPHPESGEKIYEEAQTTDIDKIKVLNRKINSILSPDIAKNFVFDGERIKKIADTSLQKNRDEISNAISSMSSLPTVKNSLRTLVSLSKKVRKALAADVGDEVAKLEEEITELEGTIEKSSNDITKKEIRLEEINKRSEGINNELLLIDEVNTLQRDLMNHSEKKRDIEEDISNIRHNIYEKYSKYLLKREVFKLYRKFENVKGNDSNSNETIPQMTTDTIDFLIQRGTCLCGTHINDAMLKTLNEQMRYQPPISKEALKASYINDVNSVMDGINILVSDIERLNEELDDKYYEEFIIDEEIDDLNSKIDSSQLQDVTDLREEDKRINEEKGALSLELSELNSQLDENKKHLRKLQAEFEHAKDQQSVNEKNKIKEKILHGAIKTLENLSTQRKSEIRHQIELLANGHFTEIISKNKYIKLDENFEHKVYDEYDELTSLSSGELIAVSMSIILAIIETHKERVIKHDNDLESYILTDKEFFLVMDGPFAVLDEEFSASISKKLSTTVEQVILLTNDNQYNDSVKIPLANKISNEYLISAPIGESENLMTEYLEVIK